VSSELSPDQRHLLVHFLHLEDAGPAIAQIKSRYETPLREVFP
jgi:multicomponent K+:H+ antiporter subunit E